jgi:hypothetical protein
MAAEQQNIDRTADAQPRKEGGFKSFFKMGEVGGYFFRGKDPSRPSNINLNMMHGINKISIVIFLLGVIFIILKRFL